MPGQGTYKNEPISSVSQLKKGKRFGDQVGFENKRRTFFELRGGQERKIMQSGAEE